MNKTTRTILAIFVMITVVSPVYSADPQQELDALVMKWTESLIAEDIEGFLSCYWDDAVRLVYFPGQEPTLVDGIEAMRIEEQKGMDEYDFASMNLIYDEPIRFFPNQGGPTYVYPNSRFAFMDIFEFEKRRGRYRIVRQYLFPHPPAD